MSNGQTDRADISLSDQAIDWLVLLHSGNATEQDHQAFAAWRATSGQHELAAREADAIWQGLGVVASQARDGDRSAARKTLTRRALLGSVGIAVLGLAVERTGILGAGIFADYKTALGERRVIDLPDGSTAQLNGDTALSVNFSPASRSLTLHGGQATFTVVHDSGRPFTVHADYGTTQALGTVFDVDIRPDNVVVTVVEGTVAVSPDRQAGERVMASANQRVRYTQRNVSAAEPIDSETETAWRRGKLIFNNRPLGDVLTDISRYRREKFVLVNDRLDALKVTGVFDLADPESILSMIETTLPVRVTRLPLVTILR